MAGNIWEPNREPEKKPPGNENKSTVNMAVVGYNLLGLAGYTILFQLGGGGGGFILDAFVIFIHVLVCVIMALGKKSWMWLLSGVLVLAIGFSTCVMLANSIGLR